MEWRDEGLIIGLRRHGEASVIAELMTRDHGRHLGIVRGGRSRRHQPVMQQGNSVEVTWRARLEDHLGTYALEATQLRAAGIMESPLALAGIGLIGELLRLLPERDPHPDLYEMALALADNLPDRDIAPAFMVRFELAVLAELGFGLDLESCAATGAREDLVYVSPKSGRAVSADAGAPWKDRLLPLPAFLTGVRRGPEQSQEVLDGFRLTGFFLERDIYLPRNIAMPQARVAFMSALARAKGEKI